MTDDGIFKDGIRIYRPLTMEMFRIACGHDGQPGIVRDNHHNLLVDARTLETAKKGQIYTWMVREGGTHLCLGDYNDAEVVRYVEQVLNSTSRISVWKIVVVAVRDRMCAAFLRPVTAFDDRIDWREPDAGREA